jgi:hypothetical protein
MLFGTVNVTAQLTKLNVGACTKDLDCVLLGKCVNGQCVCDEGWIGTNCHEMDLIPSKQANIEGFDDPAYPTWCTRVIWSEGEWHMISSYIRGKCGLWDYDTNGAILRAVGPTPMGPFTFKEEIVAPFHHGAHIERNLNGDYLIFGDGRAMPQSTIKTNCAVTGGGRGLVQSENLHLHARQETNIIQARDLQNTNLYPKGNSPNDVHMVYTASKISGPWRRHEFKELQTDVSQFNRWNCNKTNLAPLLLRNGSVVMGYRSKSCVDMQYQINNICGKMCQRIGIAVSHHGVYGPYQLRPDPISGLDGNEDPFMWSNDRGYFMVFHGKVACGDSQAATNTCGSFAYSPDTYTWYMSPFPMYNGLVRFHPSTGKTSETLMLRHRPKILFSNEGVPMVLYNAGQRFGQQYVRSFAFAFNTEAMRNFEQPPECPAEPFLNKCTTHQRRNIVYDRTEPGCKMLGSANCIWCPNKNLCMPGTDERICKASSVETFFAHC